jgi:hypothetical protein
MKNITLKLPLLTGLLLGASWAQAQTVYQAVSIIGSATAGGWTTDTPMRTVSATDVHNWRVTLPLTGGQGINGVKFRANNDWTVNWGSGTFPMGTGTANGQDIPIPLPAGTTSIYTVQFNDVTGAYQFTLGPLASKAASGPALALALLPNPAREMLSVTYELPAAGPAWLTVYNQLGQSVRQVATGPQPAGAQTQPLSLQGLAPGLYSVQLQAGAQRQLARLVVE